MNKLINQLIKDGYLKTDAVIEAFSEVGRVEFVPDEFDMQADSNVALPIGFGQTIPQPLIVAVMLELLSADEGQRILNIGSGSGWTASLMANIVGKDGKVYDLERKKELLEYGKKNAEKFGYVQDGVIEFHLAETEVGLPENAPYDRIIVFVPVEKIPESLKDQLKIGGRLVIPVGDSIFCLEKKGVKIFSEEEVHGFSLAQMIQE